MPSTTLDTTAATATEWYGRPAPIVSVYLPVDVAEADAGDRLALAWKDARRRLEAAGAPSAQLDVAASEIGSGRPGRPTLGVLVDAAGGRWRLELDRPLEQGPRVAVDALPVLAPVLEQAERTLPHVVVVADRTGADLLATDHLGGRPDADPTGDRPVEVEVDGDPAVQRSHPGGWSQRRFQQRAENTWERNAAGVADEVADLVASTGAEVVVVAGDERAVGFLRAHLPTDVAALVRVVEGAGRSAPDPFDELRDDVERAVATEAAARTASLLRGFAEARASGTATEGAPDTLAALARSQVGTLLVHDDAGDEARAWFDRASAQTAATREGIEVLGRQPVAARRTEVAIRSALMTGAAVSFVPGSGPSAPADGLGGVLRY